MNLKKVAIYGIGFMGASLSLALRKNFPEVRILGLGRNRKKLEKARRKKIISEIVEFPPEDTQIFILSIPVRNIPEILKKLINKISPYTLITDTGSTKLWLKEKIYKFLPSSYSYIGSHPFCGSEKQGMEEANPDIFQGSICFVTPEEEEEKGRVKFLRNFWESIGSKVILTSSSRHDEIVAFTSHLPHFVAVTLVNSIPEKLFSFTGSGFYDTTRIARGGVQIWEDIFLTNQKNLLEAVENFESELRKFKKEVKCGKIDKLLQAKERFKL